jgi:predicted nucleic acid-binding protein
MTMETVYIETTIVSYLVANSSREAILAAHQLLTRQWWQNQRSSYQCLVSDETLTEAARGDVEQARLRLEALQGLPALPITLEVENLADAILQSGSLPAAARSDAIHVAAATLAGVDFLLTWNCRHLANPHLQKQLRALMAARGLTLPEICTPIELGGQ